MGQYCWSARCSTQLPASLSDQYGTIFPLQATSAAIRARRRIARTVPDKQPIVVVSPTDEAPTIRAAITRTAESLGSLFPFWERATMEYVRVFNRSTVKAFADAHADARESLFAWFAELQDASWTSPKDVKSAYPSASFLAGDRVVFNIKGNNYRIVVAVKYDFFAVYIRFIGTHAAYDKIDASTI
jgi:mRNA interferase HigB